MSVNFWPYAILLWAVLYLPYLGYIVLVKGADKHEPGLIDALYTVSIIAVVILANL